MPRDHLSPPRRQKPGARERLLSRPPKRYGSFAMVKPQPTAQVSSAALRKLDEDTPKSKRRRRLQSSIDRTWQTEAYEYADKVGELGFLLNLQANICSMVKFPVRKWDEDKNMWVANMPGIDDEQEFDERPSRVMEALVGPGYELPELIRRAAFNLACAGEVQLLATEAEDSEGLYWEFLSVEELYVDTDGGFQRRRNGMLASAEKIPTDSYTARCWISSPRFSDQATSQVKRVLPILQEIVRLTMMVDAFASSRIPAGLLFLPDGLTWSQSDGDDSADEVVPSEFVDELLEHISAAIDDPSSAASQVPITISGPADLGEKIKLIDLSRELNMHAQELRQEALGRLSHGLDAPPEIIDGMACVPDDTEILTRSGWRSVDELNVDDEVLGLDHETGTAAWAPVLKVNQFRHFGEMVRITNALHESLSTSNHRWPVEQVVCGECGDGPLNARGRCLACYKRARRLGAADIQPTVLRVWKRSDELTVTDRIVLGAAHEQADSKFDDRFVEMLAWLATDGDVTAHGRARIRQSPAVNPEKCERIDACMSDVPHVSSDDPSTGMRSWVFDVPACGTVAGTRFVIDLDAVHHMSSEQHRLLLDVGVAANGHAQGGSSSMFALDGARLDAFEMAAILLGYRVSRTTHRQSDGAFGDSDLVRLSWGPHTTVSVGRTELVEFDGRVWCPTVEGLESWVARRDGRVFYTGNSMNHWSAFQVSNDFVVKHIQPLARLIADFLTVAYLRPMLEAAEEMSADEAAQWKLDIDLGVITARADEARSARDLSELLSDEAIVEANGFTSAQMVTPEARLARRLWQLVTTDPATFGPLLAQIPGFEEVDLSVLNFAASAGPEEPVPAEVDQPDELVDALSGADEPDLPDELTVMRMAERIAAAAHHTITAAQDKTASRLISSLQGKDGHPLRERIRNVKKDRVLSVVSREELAAMGVEPAKVLADPLVELTAQVHGWVREALEDFGPLSADERTALCFQISDSVVDLTLDAMTKSIGHPVKRRTLMVAPEQVRQLFVDAVARER